MHITATHHATLLRRQGPGGMSRQACTLTHGHYLLKLRPFTCIPPVSARQPAARDLRLTYLRNGAIVASGVQSGTVKMVVQGRQIELTPSIRQYAEEKVVSVCCRGVCQGLDHRIEIHHFFASRRWARQSLTLRVPSKK